MGTVFINIPSVACSFDLTMGEGRKTRGSQVPSTLGVMLVSAAACLLSDIASPELILHTGTNEEIMSFAPEITSAQAEL